MSAIVPTATATTPTTRRARTLWSAGLVAAAGAGVATSAVAVGAHAVGVPLAVGGDEIPVAGFAQLTVLFSVVGIAIAVAMARWARRPRRTFVTTTVALTALSIVPDVLADATTATRLVLVVTHLVAAVIVIPALASRFAD
jgi:uncharacterized membrane protein YoaK (UPF0700 family)